jgi:hypothetical protein
MPYGHHIAHCLHCGKQWMVGDCIPSMCDECRESGHVPPIFAGTGYMGCQKCDEPFIRIKAAALAAEEKRAAEAKAKAEEEAEFSAGLR